MKICGLVTFVKSGTVSAHNMLYLTALLSLMLKQV
jgi:hypothetical protein